MTFTNGSPHLSCLGEKKLCRCRKRLSKSNSIPTPPLCHGAEKENSPIPSTVVAANRRFPGGEPASPLSSFAPRPEKLPTDSFELNGGDFFSSDGRKHPIHTDTAAAPAEEDRTAGRQQYRVHIYYNGQDSGRSKGEIKYFCPLKKEVGWKTSKEETTH